MQTVRPLALDRGLQVDTSDVLAEGAATSDVLALHLVELGANIAGERDLKKGSTWVLEREGDRVARASYLSPPDVG